jgi:MYB-related transcription factor LHY
MLMEFIPSAKGAITSDEIKESYVTVEVKGNQNLEKADAEQTVQDTGTSRGSKSEYSIVLHEKSYQGEKTDDLNCALQMDEMQATQNYPRHVPVQVLDGSQGTCTHTPSSDMSFQDSIFHPMREVHGHPNLFTNPAASATTVHQSNVPRSSVHQSFPAFHTPFTPICHNQDDYRSFLHMSSAFSSLIVSTLMQNPAAHAAASFAATFWHHANVETSADSPAGTEGSFPSRQMGSTPSMAAIAASTVAAASAWWSAHGLLPLCAPPLHTAYTCSTAATADPPIDGQPPKAKTEGEENALQNPPLQQLDPDFSETVQAQHSASKSPTRSSTDSEESGGVKLNIGSKATDHENAVAATELHDSNKTKGRKQVDRSSCGSNTASSSDVETDALEKHEKEKEESKELDANHPDSETSNRRCRIASYMNDSWKEVSEEVIGQCSLIMNHLLY